MEVQDGFIVGVHNYCDRWCERCTLTSHCRVFSMQAEMEASSDSNFTAMFVERPVDEQDLETGPEVRREFTEAETPPHVPLEHRSIESRAWAYTTRTHAWLTAPERHARYAYEPYAIVSWFHFFIASKTGRALLVVPEADAESNSYDCDGSAKIALIAIERSHAAWLELVERGELSMSDAYPFLADLVWLGEALEWVRPAARAFVRPGLDEPDAVARIV